MSEWYALPKSCLKTISNRRISFSRPRMNVAAVKRIYLWCIPASWHIWRIGSCHRLRYVLLSSWVYIIVWRLLVLVISLSVLEHKAPAMVPWLNMEYRFSRPFRLWMINARTFYVCPRLGNYSIMSALENRGAELTSMYIALLPDDKCVPIRPYHRGWKPPQSIFH